ncbi:xaa-pro dipeptidase app [Myriangium duriaei CBS 260.36]|uniref:Xaa-Pro aminopeptidase n=1 Tax=Myriangium duriaei CBS 260.36 TaxID=1168546 RepID=A0A9P4ITR9_9PEZI|nr:xaa-pro dipeptidase app [Myriangium duriaei CBS 260.36]
MRALPRLAVRPFANRTSRATCQRLLARRTYANIAAHKFGQPLHETHPHLLKPGELSPGITAVEYHERRARLAKSLPRGGIAVLPSSEIKTRSGAVFYEFHQQPDFFYLTGFTEPEALAVIAREESELGYSFHLFVRPKDNHAEVWDGARSGIDAAKDVFNADESHDINRVASILPDLLQGSEVVYTDVLKPHRSQSSLSKLLGHGSTPTDGSLQSLLKAGNVKPLKPVMNQLRLTKSAAEVANMRKAGKLSGRSFTDAMRKSYKLEKDLWTDLGYGFRSRGLDGEAYVPVVAGGTNGLSIHYVRNDDALHDGQLVLVDAGGEYGGYITDITRTWPVNGKFSSAQKDLYNMVLNVQRSCVSMCREDASTTLDGLHRIATNGLQDGLRSLGFDISGNAMDVLFPHHVGHHIGLDVHDAPGFSRSEWLKEGQCITMEPGIYVPDDEKWPSHFRGMAIRIEDSICVTKENPLVLTTEAVKEVDDIEALRGGGSV